MELRRVEDRGTQTLQETNNLEGLKPMFLEKWNLQINLIPLARIGE